MESPRTPRRSVREELHGTEIVDPYRWLEDGDDPEVGEWTAAQNEYADAMLDVPQREVLEDRFADLAETTDYGTLEPAGGRYFGEVRDPDAEQPVICVRDEPAGERQVLLNPNEWSDDGTVSVDWFVPSPDGELLAFGVAPGGTEQYDLRVLDVESGEVIEQLSDVGRGGSRGFGWTREGFYYTWTGSPESDEVAADGGDPGPDATATDGESDEDAGTTERTTDDEEGGADQLYKEVRYHELGTDPGSDDTIAADVGRTVWPVVTTEGETLVVELSEGWERSDVYALAGDDRELTPVVTGVDAAFEATLHEGTLYLTTNYEAPRTRVLGVSVDRALEGDVEPDEMREVVPEGEAVLRDVVAAGDRLLAHYHEDARSRLRVFEVGNAEPAANAGEVGGDEAAGNAAEVGDDEAAGAAAEVDLEPFSSVAGLKADDEPRAYYLSQSFDRPASVREVDLRTGETRVVLDPAGGFDLDVEVSQEWFTSPDGTEIPAFVVRRSGVDPDGTNPGVLTGYGGFRVNRTPTFDRYLEPFLAAGGVFTLATLRGGTEYGEDWHEAGRRERKQNVFDDFLAVAEGLVDRGWVADDRLAITGGSNGGLLVGAALTRRPELFAAVLCRVPLLDMLRFHEFLLGASWASEYGSPDDPDAFEYLRDYSPYHNVERRAYPPTLFVTAAGDTRVHPCHARKTAARVQRRTTGDDPILLRVRSDAGHGVGKPRSLTVEEEAEHWGFLAHNLGVDAADLE